MPRKPERNLIVGLDIGTSKVVAIVGELGPDGTIEVVGVGSHPSRGLKKGVVVNIDSTVQSIQRAIEEAELMAGCEIHSVFAGIAGSHVRSLNSHGIVAIRDKEVAPGDVDRVIDAARAVAIPADQKILHILPQEFIIDAQGRLLEAGLRLTGVRLGRLAVTERLDRFIRLACPLVAKRAAEIGYVDMRYTNGFSVGWNARAALAVAPQEDATPDG